MYAGHLYSTRIKGYKDKQHVYGMYETTHPNPSQASVRMIALRASFLLCLVGAGIHCILTYMFPPVLNINTKKIDFLVIEDRTP
jgi:hypothetical protein